MTPIEQKIVVRVNTTVANRRLALLDRLCHRWRVVRWLMRVGILRELAVRWCVDVRIRIIGRSTGGRSA